MSLKVEATYAVDAMGMNNLMLKWYERLASHAINDELSNVMRDEVRKAVFSDPELRNQIKEAIQAATMALPMEVLAVAIKAAISEVMNASKTESK